jgi:hypothetical protein
MSVVRETRTTTLLWYAAFHREPIYSAAYSALWWPEAGRATLPVQTLSMQGRSPTAGFI